MKVATIIFLTTAITLQCTSSFAQPKPQAKPQPPARKNPNEFKPRSLSKAPTLPNIPDYPGQKQLRTSFDYPQASSGASVTVVFDVNDKPDRVLSWYAGQLPANGWHLNDREVANSIDGQNDTGDFVKVTVNGADNGKSSSLMIVYRSQRPQAGL